MHIKELEVKYVRGIAHMRFEFRWNPNKITYFVGSNGSGKTSIAKAFESLKPRGIKIENRLTNNNFYLDDEHNYPELTIIDSSNIIYQAKQKSNYINKSFDTYVLNAKVKPRSKQSVAGVYMQIDPILIFSGEKDEWYLETKETVYQLLEMFSKEWREIELVEEDENVYLVFPNANKISNGERDVFLIFAQLCEALYKLKKQNNILVIDEVFDYLDYSNIVIAQFFLLKIIERYKKESRNLFVMFLTHLNPIEFKNYYAPPKNIIYLTKLLDKSNDISYRNLNKLVKERMKNKSISDLISKNIFHYNPNISKSEKLVNYMIDNLDSQINSPYKICTESLNSLNNYLSFKKSYNVILVCIDLRNIYEKNIYEKLNKNERKIFIKTKKTTDKFDFASEMGVRVPELYYLVVRLCNEALHLDEQASQMKSIRQRLENTMIRNIIKSTI